MPMQPEGLSLIAQEAMLKKVEAGHNDLTAF